MYSPRRESGLPHYSNVSSCSMGAKKAFKRAGRSIQKAAQSPAVKRAAVAAIKAAVRSHPTTRAIARTAMPGIRGLKSLITGHGDYTVNRTLGSGSIGTPSFGTTRINVKRRELLGSIISSPTPGAFQLQKFVVNPGLVATFPWLSGIADSFETYRPSGVIFEFLSLSGTAVGSTNTALGQVIMAPQYNAYALDPTTKVQLEGYPDAVSTCVDASALCGIECAKSNRQSDALLVRNSNVVPNSASMAAALFDLCDFYIATNGCQGSSITLGELWITYDIDLWNPIVSIGYDITPDELVYRSTGVISANAAFASGVIEITDPSSHLASVSGGTIIFQGYQPDQRLLVTATFVLDAASAADVVGSSSTGVVSQFGYQAPAALVVADTRIRQWILIPLTAPFCDFTLTVGGGALANFVFSVVPVSTAFRLTT
jgi:hypothetical protein